MDLFEFIKTLFNRDASWEKIKTYDKSKNFFMINRFMSINFPMQANLFNNRSISSSAAIDSWRDVLNRLYIKPPGWMYTKTKKRESNKSKKYPERSSIEKWIKLNKLSNKDFESMLEIMEEETINEILNFEKIIKEKESG